MRRKKYLNAIQWLAIALKKSSATNDDSIEMKTMEKKIRDAANRVKYCLKAPAVYHSMPALSVSSFMTRLP